MHGERDRPGRFRRRLAGGPLGRRGAKPGCDDSQTRHFWPEAERCGRGASALPQPVTSFQIRRHDREFPTPVPKVDRPRIQAKLTDIIHLPPQRGRQPRWLPASTAGWLGWTAIASLCLRAAEAPAPSFAREVRPILAEHCFKCHGPDEETRKAGLRFDTPEGPLKPDQSGHVAIKPGDVQASELVQRIFTTDEDDLMPPPAAKRPLTDEQREILKRWVAAGAKYEPHWAFQPPRQAPLPAVGQTGWVRNPIDAFVLARLEREGLSPSPPADRYTLLRRVSLDLIGLPPSPEEADAFARDASPDAYERVVDRLLASPHYGERWARRWLDLARYADTNGYEKDRPRSAWPWRDWVINALNADLPFDEFTIEQLAGDLLPNATPAQRIATGFHRNTMLNEEGGIDPLEYRFYAMVDRVNTTGTTWLGLTVGCAQCHPHKFDPISQREYYRLMAFFNNADEPTMDVPSAEITAKRRATEEHIAALEADLVNQFPPEVHWRWDTPPATFTAASGATATRRDDGSYLVNGSEADKDTYTLTLETTLTNVSQVKLEALADASLPKSGPGRSENGNFVLSEIELSAAPRDGSAEPVPLKIASAEADFEQDGYPAARAFDGKPDTGWAIAGKDHWNVNRAATFTLEKSASFASGTRLIVRLSQQHGGQHTLGCFRVLVAEEIPDPRPLAVRRAEHRDRRFAAWLAGERDRFVRWTTLRPVSAHSQVPVLTVQDDDSVFVSSDQTKSDTYELGFRTDLTGITAIRLEVLPDDRLPAHGPGRVYYEGPLGDFFLSTFTVTADGKALKVTRATASFAASGRDPANMIDADPQSGWSIDGGQGRRHTAVFNLAEPLANAQALGVRMLFERYHAAGLGRFRIAVTTDPRAAEASALPDDLLALVARDENQLSAADRDRLMRYFVTIAPELAKAREPIEKLRREMPAYTTTLVMAERPADHPRETFVHHRGQFLQATERVTPGVPAVLPDLPAGAKRDRLAFARWLVSPENPLTARVTVNRQWAAFFGRGLVATLGDFGYQGEPPTHPQLLDWLAVEFMQDGWSLKRLHRLIVTSATYQQDSRVTPQLLEKDPENLLLARGPRQRLEAELIRDLALDAAGLLSPKIGGPSVFPPQPASVTKEGAYGPLDWKVSTGEDRYRRGLYTFAKRTAPYAMFNCFDAPSGEACVARREVSDSPLQSLTLLNDEVFQEAAQALGREAAARPGTEEDRARFIVRRCLSRSPAAEEETALLAFFKAQRERFAAGDLPAKDVAGPGDGDAAERAAWTATARVVLNLDETITKN